MPLLPLVGGAGFLLASDRPAAAAPKVKAARFTSMAAPSLGGPADIAVVKVASSMMVTYDDGRQQAFSLAYEPFFVTGARVPDGKGGTVLAGGYHDIHGRPILDTSSSAAEKPQFFSDCPDGMSLIRLDNARVEGVTGNPVFVADRPRDLSSGSLYVARWNQKTAENGGSADLTWIKLGHATSDEIEALADKLTARDILDVKYVDPVGTAYSKVMLGGKPNWVKIVPGQETAAAFLETHRYAGIKGGSMGFTKMEGTALNATDKIAYSAISDIKKQMRDGSGGVSIEGPEAGAVYALNLRGCRRTATTRRSTAPGCRSTWRRSPSSSASTSRRRTASATSPIPTGSPTRTT